MHTVPKIWGVGLVRGQTGWCGMSWGVGQAPLPRGRIIQCKVRRSSLMALRSHGRILSRGVPRSDLVAAWKRHLVGA